MRKQSHDDKTEPYIAIVNGKPVVKLRLRTDIFIKRCLVVLAVALCIGLCLLAIT